MSRSSAGGDPGLWSDESGRVSSRVAAAILLLAAGLAAAFYGFGLGPSHGTPVAPVGESEPAKSEAKALPSVAKAGAQPAEPGQGKSPTSSADAGRPTKASRAGPLRPRVVRVAAGKPVAEFTEFKRPSAVDVAADGRWLVADKAANRLVIFDASGEKTYVAAAAPDDADFLPGGGYLITSSKTKSVIEIDSSGDTVWTYDSLERPLDADRLANGNTLIADGSPGRVLEVSPDGQVVWSHQEGLLKPSDVELAPDGSVLVADYNRHHVRCLERDGTTRWKLDHVGHPSSLQVLDDDRGILVGTHKAGAIVHADLDGRILGGWRIGQELDDLALSRSGTLLVAYAVRPDAVMPSDERDIRLHQALDSVRGETAVRADSVGVVPVEGVRTEGKNLVVVLFDSLRSDHVPWHGYWRDTAPRLSELARSGLVFDQYITQAPWTKPSVASLLTSTYASTHGATSQKPQSQLPTSLATMAEALSSAGYYTAAVMQNPHMGDRRSSKGFEQGYERYEYVGEKKHEPKQPRMTANRALMVVRERPLDRPFFLTLFFMNPHYPYEPHRESYGGKSDGPSNPGPINLYDAEIAEADAQIGRVLEFLEANGIADETIVVFSSDHGEEFGDHGKRFHGDTLYDCTINVPLVITGLDRVGRFPGLVSEVDLMPTLLDFLGVRGDDGLRAQMVGTSVRPLLEPGVARTGRVAYSQSRFRDNVHLVSERTETRKVIVDFTEGKTMIFDLVKDPHELIDLSTPETSALELARLRRWELGQDVAEPDEGPAEPVPEEVLERLRAAGYLGGK